MITDMGSSLNFMVGLCTWVVMLVSMGSILTTPSSS